VEWLLVEGRAQLLISVVGWTALVRSRLESLPGVRLLTRGQPDGVGIVSFVIDGGDSREAATILDSSFGVQCRAGFHCAPLVHQHLQTSAHGGSLRLSPGVFTTLDEVAQAADAVAQLCDAFSLS